MVGLTGTGLVADDLYLLAHHDVTGKPFLQPRALGLGLAGALLAELVLARTLRVGPDGLAVVGGVRLPDQLGHGVVSLVLGEKEPLSVQDWLQFLARAAADQVARRLERAGYLVAARQRWRGDRWVPVNADCAFAPLIRVRAALDSSRLAGEGSVVLAGLALGCGLGFRVLPFGPVEGQRWLDESLRRLGPDLRQLIAQTQAAVDGAVLSRRM